MTLLSSGSFNVPYFIVAGRVLDFNSSNFASLTFQDRFKRPNF